jgi:hypothetical protein
MKRPDLTYWLVAMTGVIIANVAILMVVGQLSLFWGLLACILWLLVGAMAIRSWRRYAKQAEENYLVVDWTARLLKAFDDPEVMYVEADFERTADGEGVAAKVRAYPSQADAEEAEVQ